MNKFGLVFWVHAENFGLIVVLGNCFDIYVPKAIAILAGGFEMWRCWDDEHIFHGYSLAVIMTVSKIFARYPQNSRETKIWSKIVNVFSTNTCSSLLGPCWKKALSLCGDLSCGEYANEGEKHLLFWLATSWLSCRQGPCIDCLMKLYCCLKNYQTLTDCAGYNWAAHSESWGDDLQATETVHKNWVNIREAEAQHIRLLTLTYLIHLLIKWKIG